MKINTNMAAQQILSNLNKADSKAAAIMERLSSGLRINKAADDAAGMAIANKMDTQVRGLKQANRNAMDGISMIQTAEGAMNEIHSILQRVRELTVQAANGTYTEEDKAAISSEIDELMKEMTTIQKNTEYNKVSLLNGSQSRIPLQVGANANQNLTIDGTGMDINQVLVGINGISANRIEGAVPEETTEVTEAEAENKAEGLEPGTGVNTLGPGRISASDLLSVTGDYIIADGTIIDGDVELTGNIKFGNNVTINGNLTVTEGDVYAGTGLTLKAGANIDIKNGNLKADAVPTANKIIVNGSVELGGTGSITNLSGTIKNLTIKDSIQLELPASMNITGDINVQGESKLIAEQELTVAGSLNVLSSGSVSAEKGLAVSGDLNIEGTGRITVEEALDVNGNLNVLQNGSLEVEQDITVEGDANTSERGTITTQGGLTILGDLNSDSTNTIMVDANIAVKGNAVLSGNIVSTNGDVTITGTVNSAHFITANNGTIKIDAAVKPEPPVEEIPVPEPTEDAKEVIINGERIQLTPEQIANGIELPANSVVSITIPEEMIVVVDGKEVTIPAGEQMVIQIGETATQLKNGEITFSLDDTVRFPGVEELEELNQSTLDLSDTAGTDKALESIDKAITATSIMRSRLGAYQNRLEHTVSNLGTSQENMTESLSRIQDADMAEEMANYTQMNVLTQAATAMLAQANQRPQQVLQLLNA